MEFRVSDNVETGEAIVEGAANFGITPESFITSFPGAGIQGVLIARDGLRVVSKLQSDRSRYYMSGQELFHKGTSNSSEAIQHEFTSYPLVDEAEDFCRNKGILVQDLVRVGGNLLVFASKRIDGHKDALFVSSKDGHLDSVLNLRVTELNTVAISRQKASLRKKITYKLKRP